MRSALFVDFDNVYSGLMRLGTEYAEAFARNPTRWLRWLVDALEAPEGAQGSERRRILVRRCYLNPEPYKRFRIGFSRAGFEIIDCPPMTSTGKTSTDIHMVLDVVDVLQSATRYDEFIVFSADADFTPLLRKLRREDRRTTIFAAGATSASYDASADLIIDPEAFISGALGMADAEPAPPIDIQGLLTRAEAVIWRAVDQADQPVQLPALTKMLAVQVPGLTQTRWAGYETFTGLLRALPLHPLRIDRELNALVDPRRLAGAAQDTPADRSDVPPSTQPEPSPAVEAVAPRPADLAEVANMVLQELAGSDRPIPTARLAQLARERFAGIEKNWLKHGSWKKLLDQLQRPGLSVVWENQAGYVLDPGKHVLAVPPVASTGADAEPQLPVGELPVWLEAAGLPNLERGRYRVLLEGLSAALASEPFQLAAVTKVARDHCVSQGRPVSRQHANYVMRGMLFNGFDPATHPHDVPALVDFLLRMAVSACRREGLKMSEPDERLLRDWLACE